MCGLFGFSDYGHRLSALQMSELLDALAAESAIRGTDACGIAYTIDGKLEIEKEPKSAYEVTFKLPKDTRAVIGHTRHSTQGSSKKRFNNHPFRGRLQGGSMFALAHNGIIANDKELRKKRKLPDTKIETDSYVAVQLLEKEKELSFKALADMAEALRGSYTFTLLDDQNNIFIVKGDSPLSILHFTKLGLYVYASTEQILWRALCTSLLAELKSGEYEELSVKDGQLLQITPEGVLAWGEFECQNDDQYPGLYDWWDCRWTAEREKNADARQDYIDELKSLAGSFGYTPDDVDYMLRCGYNLEEIEEILYGEDCDYALREK